MASISFPEEIRKILKEQGVKTFEKTSNANIILGKIDDTPTFTRTQILETLAQELIEKFPKKVGVDFYKSKKIGATTLKSGKGVLYITYNYKEYAVYLKPLTNPNFKLTPQDFGVTPNKYYTLDDYIKTIQAGLESKRQKLSDVYTDTLFSILQTSSDYTLQNNFPGDGILSLRDNLVNTVNDSYFLNAVNTQFSEVIGPILVQKYFKTLTGNIRKIVYIQIPQQGARGIDFTVRIDKSEFPFSVKSAATKSNTIKPDFLSDAIKQSKLPASVQVQPEIDTIQLLDELSAKQGKMWLYNHDVDVKVTSSKIHKMKELISRHPNLKEIKPTKKLTKKNENMFLRDARKNLETETKKMNFTQLAELILPKNISFFKVNYIPNQKQIKFYIYIDKILINVLRSLIKEKKPLYLRDKGGPLNSEKIGLTPP